MPNHRRLTAFPSDGRVVTDHKAYTKNDLLVSDKLLWLTPNIDPARCYEWTGENYKPKFHHIEYELTTAPADPENDPAIVTAFASIWNDAIHGKKVSTGRLGESTKLQIAIAAIGLTAFSLILTLWLVISQMQPLPPLPINNVLQETPVGTSDAEPDTP